MGWWKEKRRTLTGRFRRGMQELAENEKAALAGRLFTEKFIKITFKDIC